MAGLDLAMHVFVALDPMDLIADHISHRFGALDRATCLHRRCVGDDQFEQIARIDALAEAGSNLRRDVEPQFHPLRRRVQLIVEAIRVRENFRARPASERRQRGAVSHLS